MKMIKLSSIIFILLLIGLSPKNVTHPDNQAQPRFISGAVSTNIGFSQTDESLITYLDTVAVSEGETLFQRHCGRCHSTGFVLKSGIHSVLADSLVNEMAAKAGFSFDPSQHYQIVQYLRFILPEE